jgi:NAD(P)-dependent dehydrogenase (short-subunit alcohol dehydrogenase family)
MKAIKTLKESSGYLLIGSKRQKSNFVYGSTKAAFTQYLAGLRQELASRKIIVNALVIGYIRTKINEGLELNESLIMEPDYVAKFIVNAGNSLPLFRILNGRSFIIF